MTYFVHVEILKIPFNTDVHIAWIKIVIYLCDRKVRNFLEFTPPPRTHIGNAVETTLEAKTDVFQDLKRQTKQLPSYILFAGAITLAIESLVIVHSIVNVFAWKKNRIY